MESEIIFYIINMKKAFNMFYMELRIKRYSGTIVGLKTFEDYFGKLYVCYRESGCYIKKIENLLKMYFERISPISTEILTYDHIRNEENQNDILLLEEANSNIQEEFIHLFFKICDEIASPKEYFNDEEKIVDDIMRVNDKYFKIKTVNKNVKSRKKRNKKKHQRG